MADTQAPPAPPAAPPIAPTSTQAAPPAPAVTADWAQPAGAEPQQVSGPSRRRRGIPAGPAMAAAGNAATLAATGAYAAGGWPVLAAAGLGMAGVGAAGVVRRRGTVKRRTAARASNRSGGTGSWSVPSSRSGGGSSGTPRAGSASGSAGTGSRRTSPGSSTAPSSTQAGTGRGSRAGSVGDSRLSRLADRLLGGTGKTKRGGTGKLGKGNAGNQQGAAASLARRAGRLAARQSARAWKASKPHRSRGAAAARRHTVRARGAAADALRSARAGLWGVIRHLSFKKGALRARAVWLKHRTKRNDRAAAQPAPAVAGTVRRPTTQNAPSTAGAPAMSGHHFVAPAMEGARAAANYQPIGMMQVGADFAGLQQALELHAEAMKITVENADAKHPLAPQIIEMMRQIHALQLKAAEMASELPSAFRNLHQVEIARIEQPRKGREGERMWDIASN